MCHGTSGDMLANVVLACLCWQILCFLYYLSVLVRPCLLITVAINITQLIAEGGLKGIAHILQVHTTVLYIFFWPGESIR